MQAPYVVNSTFAYDATRHRYVQTEMDNDATWYVSIAEPWQGNTIRLVDLATSTKLAGSAHENRFLDVRDGARAIIGSSLPLDLTRRERRLAFAKRLYAGELPDAALLAFAE